jgi:hypothetical protein
MGRWCVLPRETLLPWRFKAAGSAIKPNRPGEPEAGKGAKGGRFTDSTDDSGPVMPGNSVEDKTLTIGESI